MTSSSEPGSPISVQEWVSRLRQAAETGETLDLSSDDDADPADAASWGPDRCMPAMALREVLTSRDLTVDPRGLRIKGARFVEELDLAFVVFPHPFHLVECALEARLDAANAKFLELGFAGTHSSEICISYSEITGSVGAGPGLNTNGKVEAVGAKIGGQLNLDGATLGNPDGTALNLDGADITGGLFAGGGFTADGEVRAPWAKIGGQLILDGATLRNPDGTALNLDDADIIGDLFAQEDFTADGEVRASSAKIGGQLSLDGATLRNPQGHALVLDSARIRHLVLDPKEFEGSLSLPRAVIDDLTTGKNPPGPLAATGWAVGDIHGPLRDDWRAARRWLNTEPPTSDGSPERRSSEQTAPTSVQPWYALADVYERNGDPAAARRLRFSAANKVTRHSPWTTKIVRGIYCGLVGNGYYPLLAVLWLVAVVAIGWWLVAVNREDIVPVRASEATTSVQAHAASTGVQPGRWLPVTAETPCDAHPGYPCMNSFTFAVNSILPPAGVTNALDWAVAPDATPMLVVGLPTLKLASWALAALLLAGVTGLLRKT